MALHAVFRRKCLLLALRATLRFERFLRVLIFLSVGFHLFLLFFGHNILALLQQFDLFLQLILLLLFSLLFELLLKVSYGDPKLLLVFRFYLGLYRIDL